MRIPDSFIEEIRQKSDIESVVSSYVKLRRQGRTMVGLCPFHGEKTPSFHIYPDNGSFYCFGCGAGGDVITFVRRAENLDYVEAVKFLADRAGLKMPEDGVDDREYQIKNRILEINRETARYYHAVLLSPAGKAGYEYLKGRGLTDRTVTRFGLGFAPDSWNGLLEHLKSKGFSEEELKAAAVVRASSGGRLFDQFRNRVIYPIIDLRGNVIAFGGRVMDNSQPKYLNSPDTPVFKKSRNLFALNFAKQFCGEGLILAEGYMDVISMHQAGFQNAVATLGTALTEEQALLFARYTTDLTIAYDADKAGQSATQRAIRLLKDTGLNVRVLKIEGGKDPDEYIKTFGAAKFRQLLQSSGGAVSYQLERLKEKHEIALPEGRAAYLSDAARLLAGISSPIERDVYASGLAREFGVDKGAILLEVDKAVKSGRRREEQQQFDLARAKTTGAQDKVNPQYRDNVLAARAEEGLLAVLLKNPDFFKIISKKLDESEFVTDFNKKLYIILKDRVQENKDIEIASLSSVFSTEEMSRVVKIYVTHPDGSDPAREAEDYVKVIRSQKQKPDKKEIEHLNEEQINDILQQIAKNKTGGK